MLCLVIIEYGYIREIDLFGRPLRRLTKLGVESNLLTLYVMFVKNVTWI